MGNGTDKATGHHALLRLRVAGGFLGGVELEFADGLNCLIGGRGTGKTTALEFLRFGLGLMPDPKVNGARHRAIEALIRANLGGGRLAVDLRTRTGMRYTAERGVSETVQVTNEAGAAVPVMLDRDQIFSADVFSQNEIEEIASNPAAQLGILDRFVEAESTAIARELEFLRRQLDQTTTDLRRLDAEIEDFAARASELPVIEEKLKGIAQAGGPDATRLNAAHAAKTARDREVHVPENLVSAVQRTANDFATALASFHATAEAQLDEAMRSGANREVFAALGSEVDAFERVAGVAVRSVSEATAIAEVAIRRHAGALAARHATQEAEYRKLIAEFDEEGGRAAERTLLQQAHADASAAAKQRAANELQRKGVMAKRTELLDQISELRDRRFAARQRVAERLTSEFSSIRVTISQAADSQEYRDLIAGALKGLGLKHNVLADRIAEVFLPTELAPAVMARDVHLLSERASVDEERARRVVEALRADGGAYLIESVDLEDVPCIELLDGGIYKESPKLSTGQRCTTILPILLLQSERPLLIDQPEDNLDNAFIYETIVKALSSVKSSRQVIFVTHNPNIPVLGEAERVFVLESDGQNASLRRSGSVDECKDDIETILEGGREAFLQRKKRYGH